MQTGVSYLAVGVVWSIFKWARHVRSSVKDYEADKDEALKKYKIEDIKDIPKDTHPSGEEMYDSPNKRLKEKHKSCKKECAPSEQKDFISTCILFWPISLIWDCFENITISLVDNIIELTKGLYKRVTNFGLRKIEGDFKDE